jgi:hypothetical protein
MGEKWPIQFCLQHATSTISVGIFHMPQIYDMGQMKTQAMSVWQKQFKFLRHEFKLSRVPISHTTVSDL